MAELLQENGKAFSRAKEEDGVYLRDVHSFIVEVYYERKIDLSCYRWLKQ
jgi:hypothetical protein